MVSYRKRQRSFAWIIGIGVFLLAMVITFSDVYGLERYDFNINGSPPGGSSPGIHESVSIQSDLIPTASDYDHHSPTVPISADAPTIPEPATMTLLILGCGALLAGRWK